MLGKLGRIPRARCGETAPWAGGDRVRGTVSDVGGRACSRGTTRAGGPSVEKEIPRPRPGGDVASFAAERAGQPAVQHGRDIGQRAPATPGAGGEGGARVGRTRGRGDGGARIVGREMFSSSKEGSALTQTKPPWRVNAAIEGGLAGDGREERSRLRRLGSAFRGAADLGRAQNRRRRAMSAASRCGSIRMGREGGCADRLGDSLPREGAWRRRSGAQPKCVVTGGVGG